LRERGVQQSAARARAGEKNRRYAGNIMRWPGATGGGAAGARARARARRRRAPARRARARAHPAPRPPARAMPRAPPGAAPPCAPSSPRRACAAAAPKVLRDLFFTAFGYACCAWLGEAAPPRAAAAVECPPPPRCAPPPRRAPAAACAPCAAPAPAPPPPLPPSPPLPPPPSAAAARAFYRGVLAAHRADPSWPLGNADAASIAHHLSAFYEPDAAREGPGVIFDVGANRGDTTQVLISALIPAFACFRYYSLTQTPGAACPKWQGALFAVEANPATADQLAARAAFERWDLLDFVLVREAFTDAAGGVARFAAAAAGSEDATLTTRPPAGAPGAVDVALGSVDALRAARGEAARRIFLLKIDAEGWDGRVIKGAEEALRARRVKFLVAEYNSVWNDVKRDGPDAPPDAPPAWTLREATQFLASVGYECWLISPQHFIPLSGDAWHDSYEFWRHSNFVCAQRCDADLRRLVDVTRNVSLQGAPPAGAGCEGGEG